MVLILLAKIFNLFKSVKEDKKILNLQKKIDYLYLVKLEGNYYQMGKQ